MEMKSTDGKTVVSNVLQNISMSVDYDSLNMKNFISQIVAMEGSTLTQDVGIIFNSDKRVYTIMTRDSRSQKQQCMTVEIPAYIPFQWIKKAHMMLTSYLMKCTGHYDDVDVYGTSMNFPPKFLPIKFPADLKFDVSIETDADGLLRSEKLIEEYEIPGQMKVKMDLNMTWSDSRAGGPRAEDLVVPESWGNCEKIESPPPEALANEWLNSNTQFLGHLRLIPHAIRALLHDSSNTVIV